MAQNISKYFSQLFFNPRPKYSFLQNMGYDWPYPVFFDPSEVLFVLSLQVDVQRSPHAQANELHRQDVQPRYRTVGYQTNAMNRGDINI